jgi:hypothetical protein
MGLSPNNSFVFTSVKNLRINLSLSHCMDIIHSGTNSVPQVRHIYQIPWKVNSFFDIPLYPGT